MLKRTAAMIMTILFCGSAKAQTIDFDRQAPSVAAIIRKARSATQAIPAPVPVLATIGDLFKRSIRAGDTVLVKFQAVAVVVSVDADAGTAVVAYDATGAKMFWDTTVVMTDMSLKKDGRIGSIGAGDKVLVKGVGPLGGACRGTVAILFENGYAKVKFDNLFLKPMEQIAYPIKDLIHVNS